MFFELETMGPHWPIYLKYTIIAFIVLTIRVLYILITHHLKRSRFKKFLNSLNAVIDSKNHKRLTDVLKGQNEQEAYHTVKKTMQSQDFYTYLEKELADLLDTNAKVDNQFTRHSSIQVFYLRTKDKFSIVLDKVKSSIYLSLIITFFAFVKILESFALALEHTVDGKIPIESAILVMANESVFIATILSAIMLVSFIAYYSIKRKHFSLTDEIDVMIDRVLSQKMDSEEAP